MGEGFYSCSVGGSVGSVNFFEESSWHFRFSSSQLSSCGLFLLCFFVFNLKEKSFNHGKV